MKRVFDIAMALWAGLLLCLPLLAVWLVVRLTSPGPALYWSDRVGRHNRIFSMPKFRTMRIGTPAVATHLLTDPDTYLTPVGSFLRKSSLDELPQLWSILVGDMTVGIGDVREARCHRGQPCSAFHISMSRSAVQMRGSRCPPASS